MKLSYITKTFAALSRRVVAVLFALVAIAGIWQIPLASNSVALADSGVTLIASAEGKIDQTAKDNKGFIEDVKNKVERTADKNASKVERSSDSDSAAQVKARRDADRIHKRAEEDADRTQKAVDDNLGAVKRTVKNIKDALSD